MKKKLLVILSAFLILSVLCACGQKKAVEYTQAVLPAPDRIEVLAGNNIVTYEAGTEKYQKIYNAFSPNWWKTAADTPDTAPDEALFSAEAPSQLKTTSTRTYATMNDTIAFFFYESTPISWVQPTGKIMNIQKIGFVMPPVTEPEENVKGFFTIHQAAVGYSEGIFTYYYPPEIASGFWAFVNQK